MGKHKRSTASALGRLVTGGCEVVAVVAPPPDPSVHESQRVDLAARMHGLRLATDEELYSEIEDGRLADVDLVLSFLFWKLIRPPLIALPRVGCLNFHPAPLPDFRGVGGYNVAILEGLDEWGVSAHFVSEEFDTGDVVEVERFAIDPDAETAFSLDLKSQGRLLGLFERTIDRALGGGELPRTPQGEGRYVTRAEFEELRRVRAGDDVERKLRAFWYPPYPGATVEVEGRTLTLVDEPRLREVAAAYRDSGLLP